jgi:hypothetical protein
MNIPAMRKVAASLVWPARARRPAIAMAMLGGFLANIFTIASIMPHHLLAEIYHDLMLGEARFK